jgi:hypothetical protein
MKFGVVPRKTLIAKVIGLQQDRHFWRGVVGGDGWIGNRNGIDGDNMIVIGSYNLLCQFRDFIRRHIPGSSVTLKQEGNYWRLFVYSYTARMLAELLYDNSSISLNRKLEKARRMLAII